jgi:flagellar hook assembly protein FlgD
MASSGLARYHDPTFTAVQPAPPVRIAIHGNTPNPFNPRTQLIFEIPGGGRDMQLKIFDVRGRLVRTLLREFRSEGLHKVIWDGRDDDGDVVASGTYFAELVAGTERVSEKMLLMR